MIIALAGPTASGKSTLGLALAEALDGEIICVDSRQIYRELNIGTATPEPEEMARVRHHLFSFVDPRQSYSAAAYRKAAEAAIVDCQQRNKLPILVGGTGLYFRTLLYAYTLPEVPAQEKLRAELEAREAAQPGALYAELQEVDPLSATRWHANNVRRSVRALEVYYVTGKPISSFQERSSLRSDCHYFALDLPKADLYQRIQQRIHQMLQQGLLDEVQQLCERYGKDLPILQTLNYAEIIAYFEGKMSLEEAQERMFIHTRQYAKRQRTWFRRDREVQWLNLDAQTDRAQLGRQLAQDLRAKRHSDAEGES